MTPKQRSDRGYPSIVEDKVMFELCDVNMDFSDVSLDMCHADAPPAVAAQPELNFATCYIESCYDLSKRKAEPAGFVGKVEMTSKQFDDRSLHFIGIQEGKARSHGSIRSAPSGAATELRRIFLGTLQRRSRS